MFPKLICGTDNVSIISDTGTGKTMAVLISMINSVNESLKDPQVIYICANFEAALQASKLMSKIAVHTSVKVGLVAKGATGTQANIFANNDV